jgi:UDP-N-acetylmuramoylalanine--D-glutamate ligase
MNKNLIVVLGGGESGTGAALLAQRKGFAVFLSDAASIKQVYKDILIQHAIMFEEGGHNEEIVLTAAEIIKSPGIPDSAPLVQAALNIGIPVISEIEFAARYTTGKLILISGSNGKTTTTLLTYHLLKKDGFDVGLGGNVGKSFALQLCEQDHAFWVLEISSFQLDGMYKTRAHMAILTNITPDHMDRYDHDFQKYIDSKMRITQNQRSEDYFIYWANDPVIQKEINKRVFAAKRIPFDQKPLSTQDGAWIENQSINITINQDTMSMQIEELALQGRHNIHNSMAAAIGARGCEVRKAKIKEGLADFQNAEHRLEFVANVHGIEFINDSKATNVNSTWYALENYNRPVILIAGGKDKGNDYETLRTLVKQKVKMLICLGVDNSRLRASFADLVESIYETQSMEDAVRVAYQSGQKGDVVLLSPTCASFDLFTNFEERGLLFKKAVKRL